MVFRHVPSIDQLATALIQDFGEALTNRVFIYRNADFTSFVLMDWEAYRKQDTLRKVAGMLPFYCGTLVQLRELVQHLPLLMPDPNADATSS